MIRVNLLRSRITSAGDANQTFASTNTSMGLDDQKDALLKVALLAVSVIGLMIYENQYVDGMNQQVRVVQSALKTKKDKNINRKKETESLQHLEKDAKELEDKLNVLRKLSRDRLKVVKALDSIQGLIPERVWLTSLKFNKGLLNLTGQAITDDDLSEFIRNLESAGLFTNVILTQAKEVVSDKGTYKSFEVKSEVN